MKHSVADCEFAQEEGWKPTEIVEEDRPFDGYQLRDLIVGKWTVPYDIQIKREMFMGKPMLFLNVMWKYEGQMSFHLTEQVEYASLRSVYSHDNPRQSHNRSISSTCKPLRSC